MNHRRRQLLNDILQTRTLSDPHRTAYTFLDEAGGITDLSYGDLGQQARTIAARLQQLGSRGQRALLLYPSGLEFVAAFLGCLYSGVIAVPVQPMTSERGLHRLLAIARDARAAFALTTTRLLGRLQASAGRRPELETLVWVATDQISPDFAGEWQDPQLEPETLAFLQYTSGSTALPRGVRVSHGNLLHNEEMIQRAFGQSEESVIVGWLPLYHDMGLIGNVLQPLFLGAHAILMPPVTFLRRPLSWLEAIARYRATTSGGPNFSYELCVRKTEAEQRAGLDLSSWEVAFNGAEPVRSDTLERFARTFAPQGFRRSAFYPCYGLAEATLFVAGAGKGNPPVMVSVDRSALERREVVPAPLDGTRGCELVGCGHPWMEQRIAIVDPESGCLLREDQVGEIWISGPSVAQGYWGRPEETGPGFSACLPCTGETPFLRTGDLGFLRGGELFVTGRLKDLIILRGRNLYPQDLELSAERAHLELRPGCSAAFPVDVAGEERLVLVCEVERRIETPCETIAEAIRQAVAQEHEAQPYEIVLLEPGTIPKTSSGKIQRHACRERYLSGGFSIRWRSLGQAAEAGRGTAGSQPSAADLRRLILEAHLGEQVARVLDLPSDSLDPLKPPTAYGLDSLAAVELQHALESQLGVAVDLGDLLGGVTLRQLAAKILARPVGGAGPVLQPGSGPAAVPCTPLSPPLSFAQERLWFIHQLDPGNAAYNIPAGVWLEGRLDIPALAASLQEIVRRHETLRTTFTLEEGRPVQRIAPPGPGGSLPLVDVSGLGRRSEVAHLLGHEESRRGFDLERGPLWRAMLLRLAGNEHLLLLTLHHIIADGGSMGVFVRELSVLYTAFVAGRPSPLPDLPIRYADFAVRQREWMRGEVLEGHLAYWRRQLADLPVLELRGDRPPRRVRGWRGASQPLDLSPLAPDLGDLARRGGVTLFMVLLGGFAALLSRWTGQDDVSIGFPSANRNRAETRDLIGFFVNLLVLRTDTSGEPSGRDLLERVREVALAAYAHQDLPFERIVQELQPRREAEALPLVRAVLTLGTDPVPDFALPGLTVEPWPVETGTAKFDLTLLLTASDRGLAGALEYSTELFDAPTPQRLIRGFTSLLQGLAADPERRVSEIGLLTAAERHHLLSEWSGAAEGPLEATLPELFAQQAELRPDAVAVSLDGQRLTYRQLDRSANRLARHLRRLGVGPEVPVGLYLDRSLELIVALVAIAKSGGAYVPLDAGHPRQRLAYILAQTGTPLVLTREGMRGELPEDARVLCLDGEENPWAGESDAPPAPAVSPDNLAYVLYTSGSTGKPKGVAVTHCAVARLVRDTGYASFGPEEVFLQLAPVAFDASTLEIWGPLLNGGRLALAPPGPVALAELERIIAGEHVTTLWLTAGLFHQVVEHGVELRGLRQLLAGGDVLSPHHVRRALDRIPDCVLINGYGPTENTTFTCCHRMTRPEEVGAPVPLGRPIARTSIYVVDGAGQPCPAGVAGELWTGGDGLARGYVGRPDLTAERFVPHPFGEPGARLYRTGDRVRFLPDGTVEFLGRLDQQVKIRGFRIEPGEIEAALATHPGVEAVSVVPQETGPDDRRLVAYVVARPGQTLDLDELRDLVAQRLPGYMVPAAFITLAALPLTPIGKLDRRALPQPEWSRGEAPAAMATPRNPTEELVVGLWAELLGLDARQVGTDADFFTLGGHSLLATRLISRVREDLRVEVPLHGLFEDPTPAGLASLVQAARQGPEAPPIRPVLRGESLPLSFAQERLWFIDQFEPGGAKYNIPAAVRLEGRLDIPALAASLQEIVRRHEALRTTFALEAGRPVQRIAPPAPTTLPVVDLSGLGDRWEAAQRLGTEESRRGFDLDRGPLWRAMLLRLASAEHWLLLTLHHIVADGWSMGVLVRELSALCTAAGLPSPLPELPIQYPDFAVWQREWMSGEVLESQLSHWRHRLAGSPVLELPTDRHPKAVRSSRGASLTFQFSTELTAGLEAVAQQERVTLFMVLLGGFQTLLARYAGQEDVAVGTAIANRNRAETEGLIGFFVNTLVLRTGLAGDPDRRELLRRVREVTLDAYAHQDLPFEKLVEELAPERDLSHPPLIGVLLVLQNMALPNLALPGVTAELLPFASRTSRLDLTLSLSPQGNGLAGWMEFATDLFDEATVRRMVGHFERLLQGLADSTGEEPHLSTLPLLTPVELAQLLVDGNGTGAGISGDRCLHELVAAQASATPKAVAVVCGSSKLTYGELEHRAGRLARHLRSLGVGVETPVGVCVERGPELVPALLGILKAGGAYVPLDPAYPSDRLAWVLEDSHAPVLLVNGGVPDWTAGANVRIVDLADAENWGESASDLPVEASPGALAYVIYTSGSTGRPKGVEVTHANVVRLLRATDSWFGFGPADVWTLFHSYAFDFSVWEMWGALAFGGRLVVIPYDVSRSPGDFLELLAAERVTVLNQTPSAFRQLVQAEAEARHDLALRLVMFGGEALDIPGLAPWFKRHGDSVPLLVNMYGITETTVHVTYRPISWEDVLDGAGSLIGIPIPDLSLYLADRWLQPVPVGVPGEILVGGAGVARGYLGRPELTAERFIPDPFGPLGSRAYRSGDLARRRPDGDLEYLGRIDHQVKIRGFRIEPGEIEAVLASHPGVKTAVVVPQEVGLDDCRLVAYVVARPRHILDIDELRDLAAQRLPGYMVPAAFVALAALPLTPNGKLDRRALPPPDWTRSEEPSALAMPRNPTEELLVGLWAELLGLDAGRVGIDANFFALGGHSLLATRLISRIREDLRVEVPLRGLFEAPTPAGLARLVLAAREGPELLPIRPIPRTGSLPLSFAQERLWFLDRLEPGGATYNIPIAVRLDGRLAISVLAASLQEIVRRHETLRTTFGMEEGRPVQHIGLPDSVVLPVVDLSGLGARRQVARQLAARESQRSFDLARGPLWRATLLRLDAEEHWLLLILHHIITDGWSMGVFVREISALSTAFAAGQLSPLPELPIQYADFAVWQHQRLSGEGLAAQSAYWRRQLADLTVLRLPADRPHKPMRTFQGSSLFFSLSADLKARLEAVAHRERATLFMVLLGGFQALLSRWADQEDVALGTAIANRNRAETEDLIGLFVNTLVLRTDLSGDPDRRELLRRVREVTLDAYAHQDLPFEKLVEELAPERDLGSSPLIGVLLVLQNMPLPEPTLPGVEAESLPISTETARLDLTLSLSPQGEGLAGWLEIATDLFDEATARRMLGHFERLLQRLADLTGEEPRLSTLPLLTTAERTQLLVEWNDTDAGLANDRCLHELVAAQALATPDATAIVCGNVRLTYGELENRANRLAHHLRALGIKMETPVGVCLERGPELVPALLGILKAGGTYVPLDPVYPQERLDFLLEDAQVHVLVTQASLASRSPAVAARVLVESDQDAFATESPSAAGTIVAPDQLAYFIYTSGSTGRPKGVAITHRSAVALVRWAVDRFTAEDLAGVLASTSICFDLSIFELFVPLSRGGTVLLAADALALPELPAASEVTLINTVPSAIAELVRLGTPPPGLRTVNLAGEPLQRALVQQIEHWCPGVRVLNLYGPSEDTTYSTWAVVSGEEGIPTIGRPVAGTAVYVLDRHGNPVPVGAPGELHLAGTGLARGYFGRPELTAAKFIPDPFATRPGGRLYATGDLARLRPDGNLEFLGRIDHQVKIRGFRIEPGEIEALLLSHPRVEAAVVVPQEAGPEDRRLVAYVVGRPGQVLDVAELRGLAGRRLPGYMVPAAFVVLAALPLTPNGKLDRRALPRPDWTRGGTLRATAARNPTEELLVGLWAELLGLEAQRIGADANFFALGGHSLLATRLIARVREDFEVEVPLRCVFEAPTPAGLARLILTARQGPEAPPIRPVPRTGSLPLSFAQERLWFLDQLEPGSAAYNIPTAMRLQGQLDIPTLAACLREIVRRHEALRTTFAVEEDGPVQRIAPPDSASLPVVDLSGLAMRLEAAQRLVLEESLHSFALERGPLWRATLLCLEAEEHWLLLTLHHIIADGWSLGVLVREISALYPVLAAGQPSSLPELPIQYADVTVWQRQWLGGEGLAAQSAYWRHQLADLPVLRLPTDRPRRPARSSRGATLVFQLSADLEAGLEAVAQREHATLFMVLLGGFQALLSHWTGQEDVAVGTAIANRNRAETEDLMGFFVNTLVLRTDLSGDPDRRELLRRVREVTLDAYAHQDLPFEKLVEELAPERDLSRSPLIGVLMVLQNMPLPELVLPGILAEPLSIPSQTARFDLTVSLARQGEGLAGWIEFATDLFDEPTVGRMLAHFERLLAALAGSTGEEPRLSALLPLTPAERAELLSRIDPQVEIHRVRHRPPDRTAPGSPLADVVAGILADILGLERVGMEDNFFDLGGHSLLATRAIFRLRTALAVDLPVRQLFETPTAAALAAAIRRHQGECLHAEPPIVRIERTGPLPLSFSQERLWFIDQLDPGSALYNIPAAVRLQGPLDVPALAASLEEIVRRHEALRTTFALEDGRPVQRIASPGPEFLPVVDLRGPGGCPEVAQRLATEESRRGFDLERGPLWRAMLLRLGSKEHWLLFNLHHIVADGWSMGVFVRELSTLYEAFVCGRPSPLPELPIQYADFAVWQREWMSGEVLEGQLAYWRRQLAGAPGLELPGDRPPRKARGSSGASRSIELSHPLAQGLEELARREGVTLFMVLLAGFTALLSRCTGQDDISIGFPVANRNRAETEGLIGFFVNTLVLRTDLSGDPAGRSLLARVREVALAAYTHQDLPFEKLIQELQPRREGEALPLVRVVLTLGADPIPGLALPGLSTESWPLETGTAKFDLTLQLSTGDRRLTGTLEYSTELYDAPTPQRLIQGFASLLQDLAADPERRVSELSLLTGAERHHLLFEWSGAAAENPLETTIPELFAQQVQRRPDAVAVSLGGRRLTYGELDHSANRLAHHLRRLGAGPEVPVALYLERSLELIVTLVAIVKSGGAYVPLDPSHPRQRLAFLLAQTGAPIVLTREGLRGELPDEARALCLDGAASSWTDDGVEAPAPAVTPENLAYILYTSGSTGEPKGVAVTHRSVVRLVRDTGYAKFDPEEVFLQLAPVAFDASTLEIWGPLLNGGRLALAPPGPVTLAELEQVIARERVTTLWLTAGLFHQVIDQGVELRGLRQLLAGGDVLSPPHVRRALEQVSGCVLVNGYGPTENTTFTCCDRMTRPEEVGTPVPLGRPIARTSVFVVDRSGQPCPAGIPGELWAGGDGLARGYVGRPDLTAERFVPHPFGEPGARLYRTGDRVRFQPDGTIEFLGRLDQQVKIRGFRIEPGEIEAVLAAHPGVEAISVVPQEVGPDDLRLAAYVVARPGQILDFDELRDRAAQRLPGYMMPAAFVALATLPLTPNGKVDRRALPQPEWSGREEPAAVITPRNPTEELLVGLWAELLGLDDRRLGIDADFFALGGHSLLATRLLSRIREDLRVEVPLHGLFEAPTPAGLACLVLAAREGPEAPQIRSVPRTESLPLSFAQERLWFLDQLEPGSATYNIPTAVRLEGRLDIPMLAASLQEIVRRHEALRTTFAVEEGRPVQRIVPSSAGTLPVIDLSGLGVRWEAAQRLSAAEGRRSFDLERGPLWRVTLLRLAAEEHLLLLILHHIVSDGWSMGVFIREISALYTAFAARSPSPLRELPIQYADFAVWQHQRFSGEGLVAQSAYWRRQLANLAVLRLPTDRPPTPVRTSRGSSLTFSLSADLKAGLEAMAHRERTTLFMVLLGGFQALVSRWAGQEDVALGTAIANRNRAETEDLIGFFVNTLVLRTDLSGDPDRRELLRRVREVTLDAYAHQDLPFERLVEELAPERDMSRPPLIGVLLVLQNMPLPELTLPGIKAKSLLIAMETARLDLTLSLAPQGEGLAGSLEFATDLFDEVTVRRLAVHFERLLAGLAASIGEEPRLSTLPLLTPAEGAQLLVEWNDTGTGISDDRCLHELVAAQASATSDVVAVVCGSSRLTYRELERQANRLAHRLRALGVGAETPVGVCLERGPELVPALLGILKAGGAYVPLDPAYPQERLDFLLDDARVPVLVTQGSLAPRFPAIAARVLVDANFDDASSAEIPGRGADPDQLAYLIYTSGSTGRPKGVAITHRSAVALVRWAIEQFAMEELAGVLASTSLCFDLSIFELFVPLSRGGTVLLAADALALPELPAASEVTLINTVPSAIAELVRLGPSPPGLRIVNLAGEPLQRALVQEVERWCPGVRVLNLYGPSEDTTYSTWAQVSGGEGIPSIGRPVAGTSVYLLDRYGNPVPVGAPGELHLAGAGLARGYFGRPELTAARFIPDPFAAQPGHRHYATGDLARLRPDGSLEFLGRRDHQVKIRGFRIELGEIEAALAGHPAVREVAVLVAGERLVAHLTSNRPVDVAELRGFLQGKLPASMVPGAFVVLDAFPLTPNGKLDRRALPAPAEPTRTATVPRSQIEEVVAGILAAALGLERVGMEDNFFDLGGHSLLATRAVSQLRVAFAVDLPVRQLFDTPTAAALATAIGQLHSEGPVSEPPIVRIPRTGSLPLSFSQERLWFLDRLQPESAAYNMPIAARLRGALDPVLLARSLNEIVRRHETLRTTFGTADGQPFQRVAASLEISVPVLDLGGLAPPERDAELTRQIAAERAAPFDLERGPLLRARLFRLTREDWAFLVDLHHIVSDGLSLRRLFSELTWIYGAFAAGEPSPLPDLEVQYADYARWQRQWLQGEVLEHHLDYWRRQLGGTLPILDLPTDRLRPPIQTFHGASQSTVLPGALITSLRALGRQQGATLFMTLFAAFNLLLHRFSGQEDILVGIPIAGRNRAQIEILIGFFINSLVLRTDLSGQPTFSALLARVRKAALDAYAHQDLSFERLLQELRLERDLSRTPLFQVYFNFQNYAGPLPPMPGLEVESLSGEEEFSKFDLTLYVLEEGDSQVRLDLVYNAGLFNAGHCREMLDQFAAVLTQAAAQPDAGIDYFSLLTPQALQLLPDAARDLDASWIGPVHQHLTAWAARDPERPAVTDPTGTWSYGELEAQSNRLARLLLASGTAKEETVAIYAHRSAALVWAVLGVLKAGAAFVVLDPAYPPARILEILQLARPRAWLAMESAGAVPETLASFVAALPGCRSLKLPPWSAGADGGAFAGLPAEDPGVPVGPDDLAYIAFTSGSTGAPKGILGRHGPLSHFLPWQREELGLTASDRFSLLSGLAHDPLQRDLFTPLYLGARICIPDPAEIVAPGKLSAWMCRQEVSVAHLTPAMGQVLTESGPQAAETLPALRYVFLVGDILTRRDIARLQRLAPSVTCVNLYGSTETQRAVGYHLVPPSDAAPGEQRGSGDKEILPLGRGMKDVQLLVRNRAGQPAGIGELGEIAVRSPHLARGYLGDEETTARKFLVNPVTRQPGDRLYLTGDLGRYLPSGDVVFVGRADTQVKIRGFRIELGEIESHLGRVRSVREAVVLAIGDGGTDGRLVGFVVPEPGAALSAADLRGHLKAALPAYMLPGSLFFLPELPLTPNGKVDRRALLQRASIQREDDAATYRAPRTQAEIRIASILREVLGIDRVGVEENFFDLGGNSLLLLKVQSRVQAAFGRDLPVLELFSNPTVSALARYLAPPEPDAPTATVAAETADQLEAGKRRRQRRFQINQKAEERRPGGLP